MKISSALVKIDNLLDYIPVACIISNYINLFQIYAVLPLLKPDTIAKNHYLSHLDNKSFGRMKLLMLPVLGNLLVGIYDFTQRKRHNKEYVIRNIQSNGMHAFRCAAPALQKDPYIIEAILKKDPLNAIMQTTTEEQRADLNFMLQLVKIDGLVLRYASDDLRKNKDLIFPAMRQNVWAFEAVHSDILPEILKEWGPLLINDDEL